MPKVGVALFTTLKFLYKTLYTCAINTNKFGHLSNTNHQLLSPKETAGFSVIRSRHCQLSIVSQDFKIYLYLRASCPLTPVFLETEIKVFK
jgi:hypothetical protein